MLQHGHIEFEKCWKNVGKIPKTKKSNILPFRKKSDITVI